MNGKYIVPDMGKPTHSISIDSIDLMRVIFTLGCRIVSFRYLSKFIIFIHINIPINYDPNFFINGSTREVERYLRKLIQMKAPKGYVFRFCFQEDMSMEWSEESYNTRDYQYMANELPFELTSGEKEFIKYLNEHDPYYINKRRIMNNESYRQAESKSEGYYEDTCGLQRRTEGAVSDRILYKGKGPLPNYDGRRHPQSSNPCTNSHEEARDYGSKGNGEETLFTSSVVTEGS
jgi:hypothetical protein